VSRRRAAEWDLYNARWKAPDLVAFYHQEEAEEDAPTDLDDVHKKGAVLQQQVGEVGEEIQQGSGGAIANGVKNAMIVNGMTMENAMIVNGMTTAAAAAAAAGHTTAATASSATAALASSPPPFDGPSAGATSLAATAAAAIRKANELARAVGAVQVAFSRPIA
jgi:hypothetical protein